MAGWSDDPATSSTHIRAAHISELRRTVDVFRAQAGLPSMAWTDNPVTDATHIRAQHFNELRSAIQDLWTYHGFGALPNWSVGTAPSSSRQVSARDMNDLRSWVNRADPPLQISTGFHWCNPVDDHTNAPNTPNAVAEGLLQTAQRWGAVLLLDPGNSCIATCFQDALTKIMDAREATGGGRSLDQSIVRLYNSQKLIIDQPGQPNNIQSVADANTWLQNQGYFTYLDKFVGNGGRNVVIFNELNQPAEPQVNIDPRIMGYLSYALQNRYYNGGNRQLYTLFPGPGGFANGSSQTAWTGYWDTYDLRDTNHNPQTFGTWAAAKGVELDTTIQSKTMLWHNGMGVFDRVALHGYANDPTEFRNPTPGVGAAGGGSGNPALNTILWYLNPPNNTPPVVDNSGYCYMTECGGQCASGSCFGDSSDAGSALADFESNANALFAASGAPNPRLLQAAYGYILDTSNSQATQNGRYEINSNYIGGYHTRQQQLFGP
jgi:hypothetical protein